MRRIGGLWARIVSWENFMAAAHLAACGKRDKPATREFFASLERNISRMIQEVREGRFQPGEFTRFIIHDPKKREICAPSFRDRVLHHALMNHCEGVFERRLIHDTYACRRGKGQQAAVKRAARFASRFRYFLKMDVRRYFDSVDQGVLRSQLAGIFREDALLSLLETIIASYRTAPGKGIPIGALTSQHFANSYLGPLDRFVKQDQRMHGYVRYMDDFVVWADDSAQLKRLWDEVATFLSQRLALDLKQNSHINGSREGVDFLGYRIFPDRIQLSRRSRQRYARKLRDYAEHYHAGHISDADLQQRLAALTAFPLFAKSWHFRRRVLNRLAFEV